MRTLAAVLVVATLIGLSLGDDGPDTDQPHHETWTFIGSERGTDEIGRDVLVLLCEKRGQVERVRVKHGQDDTFADVVEGDSCPGTLDPHGPKP